MATRQRAQRGEDQKEFEGRVRKWKREWHTAGGTVKTKKLSFLKWTPTDERDLTSPGKRFPDIKPLPTPGGRPIPPPFMRLVPPPVPRGQPAVSFAPMPAFKVKLNTSLAKQGSTSQNNVAGAPAPAAAPSQSGLSSGAPTLPPQ